MFSDWYLEHKGDPLVVEVFLPIRRWLHDGPRAGANVIKVSLLMHYLCFQKIVLFTVSVLPCISLFLYYTKMHCSIEYSTPVLSLSFTFKACLEFIIVKL